MKSKVISTTLAALTALAISVFAQNDVAPNSPASFSVFALPQNVGAPLNSAEIENAPFLAPNGLSLYFSGDGRAGGFGSGDVWVSKRTTLSSAWGTPQNLGAVINGTSNDNTASLSPDGLTLFFTSDKAGGFGGQDMYLSTRTNENDDFSWSAPVNMGPVLNTPLNEGGQVLFVDPTNGNVTLYFLAIRDGGLGDFDIYQSTRNPDGTFNPPTNVTEVNSTARDARPSIRSDGLEMLFTSERAGGLGFADIWVSTRASTNSAWNPPVNATRLNSSAGELGATHSPDGSVAYLASARNGGFGSLDIYTATRVSVNRTATSDFDGDGRADISIFRTSSGTWWLLNSGDSAVSVRQFGSNGDRIVPGDYDGDSRTDLAIFRPSTGVWWISRSSDNSVSTIPWGISTDKPVPDDYDGDGRTDIAVYRDGTWYIVRSSTGTFTIQQFGLATDIPVTASAQ